MSFSSKQKDSEITKKQVLNEVMPQSKWQTVKLFAIITWGSTGTNWLSKILNLHPEIFCVHELAIVLNQSKLFKNKNFWDECDPIDFMKIVSRLSNARVHGDVHSINPKDVPTLKEYFGKNFSTVVIQREPISRLKSTVANFNNWLPNQIWNIDFVDDLIRHKGISIPKYDYEHKLFVFAAHLLNTIEQETKYDCGTMYTMEDLILDKTYLKSLIEEISTGALTPDDELLDKMINTSATNQRASKEKIEFEDWQYDVIKTTVNEKTWELYSKLGYSKPDFL